MLPFMSNINLTSVFGVYVASIPFDFVHGVTNVVLLLLFFGIFKRIFKRARDKFIHPDQMEKINMI